MVWLLVMKDWERGGRGGLNPLKQILNPRFSWEVRMSKERRPPLPALWWEYNDTTFPLLSLGSIVQMNSHQIWIFWMTEAKFAVNLLFTGKYITHFHFCLMEIVLCINNHKLSLKEPQYLQSSLGQKIEGRTVTSEQVSQSAVFCASPSGTEWSLALTPSALS